MSGPELLISSTSNPRIKALLKLEDSRYRRSSGLFFVEGRREVSFAQSAGYLPSVFFYCPDIFPDFHSEQASVFRVSKQVYEKIAYRGGTEGIIGVFQSREHALPQVSDCRDGVYLVLESVEKPGNLGAILRTADAAGVNGVILTESHTDIYNPNTIRSSVGAFFTVPLYVCDSLQLKEWLLQTACELLVLSPEAETSLYSHKVSKCVALLYGTESTGVSEQWKSFSGGCCVSLPMRGSIDSLNVSNSVAISVFEVLRQQGKV